jgi:hypothetical protein
MLARIQLQSKAIGGARNLWLRFDLIHEPPTDDWAKEMKTELLEITRSLLLSANHDSRSILGFTAWWNGGSCGCARAWPSGASLTPAYVPPTPVVPQYIGYLAAGAPWCHRHMTATPPALSQAWWLLFKISACLFGEAPKYYNILFTQLPVEPTFNAIWKSRFLPKLRVFIWLVMLDRLNTRDPMIRKNGSLMMDLIVYSVTRRCLKLVISSLIVLLLNNDELSWVTWIYSSLTNSCML